MFRTLLLSLFITQAAHAYPTFQRLGYIGCTTCHFLPTGGGTLTTYGRGIGDTLSAFPQEVEREPKPYMQMFEARTIGIDSVRGFDSFLMQADYLASYEIDSKWRADASLGLGLERPADGSFVEVSDGANALVLRRALLSYALAKGNAVQVGRDLLPNGLNIDDHTSFLRSSNKRNVLDYPTQARYDFSGKWGQIIPYVFGPTFEEDDQNREWGAGVRAEYQISKSQTVGLVGLLGASEAINRGAYGMFTRLSPSPWSGVIAEFVRTHRALQQGSAISFDQDVLYLRPYVALPGWLETGLVYESLSTGTPFEESITRWGPAFNARMYPGVTLLLDFRKTERTSRSEWMTIGQIFLWL